MLSLEFRNIQILIRGVPYAKILYLTISTIVPSFGIFVARRTIRNWKRFKNDHSVFCIMIMTHPMKIKSSTLLLSRLKILLLETFKSLRHTYVECLHGIFNPKMSPYVTWGPQILCNRKGTQPLTGYDRSRISDIDFGIIWLMIFHFYVILITTVLRNLQNTGQVQT